MGIYATMFMIAEPWPAEVHTRQPDGTYETHVEQDSYGDKEEERLGPPYAYHGSHIMPHKDAERRGNLEVGYIPGHIWRDYDGAKVAPQPDEECPHPYVRLGLMDKTFAGNSIDVVLDREQVKALHDSLGAWLEWTKGSAPR
jgi:hypothetical protein